MESSNIDHPPPTASAPPDHRPRSPAPPTDLPPLPAASPAAIRGWAALVLAGCVALLSVAAWLKPDPRGFGTHEQLGAAQCGSFRLTGYPCPTCGMTTAFSHVVRGHLVAAFWAQPTGMLMAVATLVLAFAALWAVVRGRWPQPKWMWYFTPYRLLLAFLVLFVAGWAFKIVVGVMQGLYPYG